MPTVVYRITDLLAKTLADVPVGTNLGLLHLLLALLSGHFLNARGAVFPALDALGLPQLALLAGNVLSYVAATSAPVASGFWDRCACPTCGRLRRVLHRVHFCELPVPEGQLRKKNSVTAHLPTGVKGHRRTKAVSEPVGWAKAA